ncbi:hypothetical protein [Lentzea albida]|uniref:Uncharacterized protein n=1 Tax=Lentzea albida TaxID=65499 RepID=A0A1H9WI09_9PSEU|nr:hypothetical protein [Lentzea albida]SES33582.1 hypothetical protein SAMN04488000_122131 [Lentzea albida]
MVTRADDEIRGTRTMQAEADIVLNTAADPSQEAAWLPDWLRDCELDLNADERTLRWVRDDEPRGFLAAQPRGAGSSEVEMVTYQDVAGIDAVQAALGALEAAVAEKLTAG